MTRATIEERGNGLADVGEFVAGDDGQVYVVEQLIGPIHTGTAGRGNYVHAELALADWSDIDDNTEPRCSAVLDSNAAEEQP